jgi:hypothetical protein
VRGDRHRGDLSPSSGCATTAPLDPVEIGDHPPVAVPVRKSADVADQP